MSSMDEVLVLIDYYNLPPLFRGREYNYKDHEIKINYIIDKIVLFFDLKKTNNRYIKLRFYGGWYDENINTTNDYDLVEAILKKVFSTTIKKNRYSAEIADKSLSSDYLLFGTLRREDGLPDYFVKKSKPSCACNPNGLEIMLSWSKGKCNINTECDLTDSDFFYTKKQKIVDTLIVADALFYQFTTKNDCIVLSHDDDMLPSLLYLQDKKRVTLLRPERKKPSLYDNLKNEGYQIIDI